MSIIPFERSFASCEKSKYWSDKNILKPCDVYKSSGKKYWFDCECKHSFEKSLDQVSRGGWCPYCSNPPKLLCGNCNVCYNKSFASEPNAKYWNEEKNGNLKPLNIFKNGDKICWFTCNICNHPFDAQIKTITKGQWCPYCSDPPKRLCDEESCILCYEKSFASDPKVIYWNQEKNGTINPRQLLKGSHKECWFNCNECNHAFSVVLYGLKRGWCNYCANKILCNDDNCAICYNKSFASNSKANFWDKQKNGDLIPRNVFMSSSIICHFICNKCATPFANKLNHISSGVWCPYCVNKTEGKLYETLVPLYPTLITQFKQEWCKKLRYLPFDFCIPEYKIIIELDGPQHFQQISNWASPEEQLENDKYKEQCANDNNYSVIRLLQEDVFYDTYDWLNDLCGAIEELKNGDEIANMYLCKNGEYDSMSA